MKSNEPSVSPASDFLELVACILQDAAAKCTADVEVLRDLMTIRARVEHEGMSFLTISLPNFSRDFEAALELGYIDSSLFAGYKKAKEGRIPAFLQGIVSQVFNRSTGELIDEPPTTIGVRERVSTAIASVRQICRAFAKVEIPCTQERVGKALRNFVDVEQSFSEFALPDDERSEFLELCHMLWSNVLRGFNPELLLPRHGPGATAEKILGNQKYQWVRWHERLDSYFPLVGFGYPISLAADYRGYKESWSIPQEIEEVTLVPEADEQPVRVVTVPKTLKAPRIIAIEPVCMQYAQQALRRWLYQVIERHWLTGGHVNFTDQSINQQIAVVSSSTGRLATIDLSDASDRVPWSLVKDMLSACPGLTEYVDACRSRSAELPDGHLVTKLEKFASMGSALCFPIEAMYFYTVCVKALLDGKELSYTHKNLRKVASDVYVYGDDIAVPSANAVDVLDYLQKYNCKVNRNKTFVTGKFRESCGVDAYDGHIVNPIYIRRVRPKNIRSVSEIASWAASANLFKENGYDKTAEYLYREVEKHLGPLPLVSRDSHALGRVDSLRSFREAVKSFRSTRWNKRLQRLEGRAWVIKSMRRTDAIDGYAAMSKSLLLLEHKGSPRDGDSSDRTLLPSHNPHLGKGMDEFTLGAFGLTLQNGASLDEEHLLRSVHPGDVALSHRWVPVT